MPEFIKHIEDCKIIDGQFLCWDEIEGKLVICEVTPTKKPVKKEQAKKYFEEINKKKD